MQLGHDCFMSIPVLVNLYDILMLHCINKASLFSTYLHAVMNVSLRFYCELWFLWHVFVCSESLNTDLVIIRFNRNTRYITLYKYLEIILISYN